MSIALKTTGHDYTFCVGVWIHVGIMSMCLDYWCMCTCVFICVLLGTARMCTHENAFHLVSTYISDILGMGLD